MLSYFSNRLLQNPRLRYFLANDKSGRTLHLEKASKDYIDNEISKYMASANESIVDAEGPFSSGASELAKPNTADVSRAGGTEGQNLTGQWSGSDGGTYFIRHVGNQLWWFGQSSDNGATFSNVFNGTVLGNQVMGEWSDVPPGKSQNAGYISLQIIDANHLQAVTQTGGFGGSKWERLPLPSTTKA
jgi:hypothetical protein